jgi:hypothetical protein
MTLNKSLLAKKVIKSGQLKTFSATRKEKKRKKPKLISRCSQLGLGKIIIIVAWN